MDCEQTAVKDSVFESIDEASWQARAETHENVVGPYIDAYRYRRSSRTKHPVHDFLFAYYQLNRTVMRRWRPDPTQVLQGEAARQFLSDPRYRETEMGVGLDFTAISEKELKRIAWTANLIRAARARPARFNCFGLHEWAMVYKADEIRHETTPLRLSKGEVAKVVENGCIRCSHFDAFRFFTPEARPLNELQPQKEDRDSYEQFGCIHFNMDLYRWSYKGSPWIGSDLMRDCFLLALDARELDMRASPYDLSDYGYEAILIETSEGRERYVIEQKRIHDAGQVLAGRLLAQCDFVLCQAGVAKVS
ncbi:3-methyladenine DNA glycosylase [Pelagicoccus albus]|uniref:3-methyladenine DNA glycosylase n=1 Tax=Pelagicoccus albus TaxID=415222 RepID=A0A7X1B3J0_9BACT|nr:3-methyladenine DNA glycosylase [Pelagicoccus albus]MBC2604988.1 3-methyladenine DNA glycosylase [Pelagicoccus albus]